MSKDLTVLGVGILAIIVLGMLAAMQQARTTSQELAPLRTALVRVDEAIVQVEVADTDTAQTRGLSGRASLPAGHGMLFVFEQEHEWGIWMKDMNFPIDIVWARSDGTVVMVKERAAPGSYPEVFAPLEPVRYVLEVPAGFAAEQGIAEGSKLVVEY